MDLKWHEQAISEADTASAFYKEKQPGLEIRFIDSLEDALNRIQHHPLIYRKIKGEMRKCRLPHFPYGVIYRLQPDSIEIIAVMHLRKSPGYWQQRV